MKSNGITERAPTSCPIPGLSHAGVIKIMNSKLRACREIPNPNRRETESCVHSISAVDPVILIIIPEYLNYIPNLVLHATYLAYFCPYQHPKRAISIAPIAPVRPDRRN